MAAYELKYTAEEIDGILESVDEKTIYVDATQSEHGLMSTTDKSKLDSLPSSQQINASLSGKVDKVDGKGLSTNDYDATAKGKVDAIPQNPQYTDTVYDDTALAGRVSTIEGKESGWDAKQDTLVSGTNIKTVNGESLLGSGNIEIQGGGEENVIEAITMNGASVPVTNKTAAITETDPTVPSWAKQQTKPSYDYSEIGNTPDLSGFVTKSVNDLTNYYLKSETYTKDEVAALIAAIQQFHYEIYAMLPQTGQGNVLYLIGPTGSGSDRYEEYVYANNTFTKIGDTSIDLNGYVTTSALNTALESYVSSSDLSTALAAYTPTSQLAEVATSGSYNDLSDKPTIPTITIDNTLSDSSENPVQNKVVKAALNLKADKNVTPTIIMINGIENLTNEQLANLKTEDIVFDTSLFNYDEPYIVNRVAVSAKILYGFYVQNYSIKKIVFSYYPQLGWVLSSRTTEYIERTSQKVTAFQFTPDDTHYPSEKLVKDSLDTKYEKPNGGIPASDLASGVIPTIPVQDVTVGGTSVVSNGTAVIPAIPSTSDFEASSNKVSTISGNETDTTKYPNTKAVYDAIHPAIATTEPSGGMLPNVLYQFGELSGNTTFTLATPSDNTIANHYYFTFDTPSTAPTITWPQAITSWFGGSAPTISASKHYEISVLNGIAIAMEV